MLINCGLKEAKCCCNSFLFTVFGQSILLKIYNCNVQQKINLPTLLSEVVKRASFVRLCFLLIKLNRVDFPEFISASFI